MRKDRTVSGARPPVGSPHAQGGSAMDPNATPTLGLDISKSKVDCVLRLQNEKCKSKVIANSEAGFHTLGAWLAKQKVEQVHACCEATGTYWEALRSEERRVGHGCGT